MKKSPFQALKNNDLSLLKKILNNDRTLMRAVVGYHCILGTAITTKKHEAVKLILEMGYPTIDFDPNLIKYAWQSKNIDIINAMASFINENEIRNEYHKLVAIGYSDKSHTHIRDCAPYRDPEVALQAIKYAIEVMGEKESAKTIKYIMEDDTFFDSSTMKPSPLTPIHMRNKKALFEDALNYLNLHKIAKVSPKFLEDAIKASGGYMAKKFIHEYLDCENDSGSELFKMAKKSKALTVLLSELLVDSEDSTISPAQAAKIGYQTGSMHLLNKYFIDNAKDLDPDTFIFEITKNWTDLVKKHPSKFAEFIDEVQKQQEASFHIFCYAVDRSNDAIASRIIKTNDDGEFLKCDPQNSNHDTNILAQVVTKGMDKTALRMANKWPKEFSKAVKSSEELWPGDLLEAALKWNDINSELVNSILDNGGSVPCSSKYGNPITMAARNNADKDIIARMIPLVIGGVDSRNSKGVTALGELAPTDEKSLSKNNREHIKLLIKCGATIKGEHNFQGESLTNIKYIQSIVEEVRNDQSMPQNKENLIEALLNGRIEPMKIAKEYIKVGRNELAATAAGFCSVEEIKATDSLSNIILTNWSLTGEAIKIKRDAEAKAKKPNHDR